MSGSLEAIAKTTETVVIDEVITNETIVDETNEEEVSEENSDDDYIVEVDDEMSNDSFEDDDSNDYDNDDDEKVECMGTVMGHLSDNKTNSIVSNVAKLVGITDESEGEEIDINDIQELSSYEEEEEEEKKHIKPFLTMEGLRMLEEALEALNRDLGFF